MSENDHPEDLHDAARRYLAAGLSVLPARKDQKRPTVRSWKPFQTRLPTESEVDAWFAGAPSAVCVLCGEVSGNLELIDFDQGGALFGPWCERVEAAAPGLLERLVLARTQSGGRHVAYRCEAEVSGNLKLAEGSDGDGRPVTLIETRGEGGLFLCPPTDGYAFLQGDLADLPVVTEDERDVLLGCAWELDEGPPPGGGADTGGPSAKGADISAHGANRAALSADRAEVSAEKPHSGPVSADHAACEPENAPGRQTIRTSGREVAQAAGVGGQFGQVEENSDSQPPSAENSHPGTCPPENGLRPGDDFNRRGDVRAILQKHGWVLVKPGENEYWRRPGKDSGSASATLKGGTFYNFSLNAHPFKPRESYSPLAVYALLEHGGDFEQAARALRQLGYGADPSDHGVDLSHLLAVSAENDEPPPENTDIPDPEPLPKRLLHVPGFVDEVMAHTLATAKYGQPAMAFGAALVLQAFLAGRKIRDSSDVRTNLYVLALANSGVGKDEPRKVNQRILVAAGLTDCFGDHIASGEGIEDRMFTTPSMIFQTDEIDALISAIAKGGEPRWEGIMSVLLRFFTSAASIYPMRVKAGQSPGIIDQPSLCLLGTAIPTNYYESMSPKMLTNGFFARMLVLETGRRVRGGGDAKRPLPEQVVETAKWWIDFRPGQGGGNLRAWHPEPVWIDGTPEAEEALEELRDQADDEYAKAERIDDLAGMAVWARAYEKARKLALIYAASENPQEPQVSIAGAQWAGEFVLALTRQMLARAARHVAESEFQAKCNRLIDVLARWRKGHGEEWMPFWKINRKLPWSGREHEDVRTALLNMARIEYAERPTGGTPKRLYRLR